MREKLPMRKVIGAAEVRNNLGRLLNRVHRGEEHLVVEKLTIPVAAIISMNDYEYYRRFLTEEILKDMGQRMGSVIQRQDLTEEKLLEMMEEERADVYERMYGQDA
jgi:prevent-host-death family protein